MSGVNHSSFGSQSLQQYVAHYLQALSHFCTSRENVTVKDGTTGIQNRRDGAHCIKITVQCKCQNQKALDEKVWITVYT